MIISNMYMGMVNNKIKALFFSLLILGTAYSCKEDRDVFESLDPSEVVNKATSYKNQEVTLTPDFNFSLEGLDVELPKDEESSENLRALMMKISSKDNNLKSSRKIEFKYQPNERVKALVIMRCNGVSVEGDDGYPKDMPYFYAIVECAYEEDPNRPGHFHLVADKMKESFQFRWNGPSFEQLKKNNWQIMFYISENVKNMKLNPDKTSVPDLNKLQVPVGENEPLVTEDGVPYYALNVFEPSKNFSFSNTDVPFISDWCPARFIPVDESDPAHPKYKIGIAEEDPNRPGWAKRIEEGQKEVPGGIMHLKPKGVFTLVDMSARNYTPFDLEGLSVKVKTTAYSFYGAYDFSEDAMRKNGGMPQWRPDNTPQFLEFTPASEISKIGVYYKNFKFMKQYYTRAMNYSSEMSESISYKHKEETKLDKLYGFWAMPNDVKDVEDNDYLTQLMLKCRATNILPEYVKTNANITKIFRGKPAAFFPGVDYDGEVFTADEILRGKAGGGCPYIDHGVVANTHNNLHIPQITRFPIYSSIGKRANKMGRVLFAHIYDLVRPRTFIEYIAETPMVKYSHVKDEERIGRKANDNTNGSFLFAKDLHYTPIYYNLFKRGDKEIVTTEWDELAQKNKEHRRYNWFINNGYSGPNDTKTGDYDKSKDYRTIAGYTMNLSSTDYIRKNDQVCDELHFSYQEAERLAQSELPNYGYRPEIPQVADYYAYAMQQGFKLKSGAKVQPYKSYRDSELATNGELYSGRLGFEDQSYRYLYYVAKPKYTEKVEGGGSREIFYAIRCIGGRGSMDRVAVRYEAYYGKSDPMICNVPINSWYPLYHKDAFISVTVRYIGPNRALASEENPIWADENYWSYDNEDDIVRYYPLLGYVWRGAYRWFGDTAGSWVREKPDWFVNDTNGKKSTVKDIFYMARGLRNDGLHFYHQFADSSTEGANQERTLFIPVTAEGWLGAHPLEAYPDDMKN